MAGVVWSHEVWPFMSPVTSSVQCWVPSSVQSWLLRKGDGIQGSLLQKSIKGGFLSALELHVTFSCVRSMEPLCWGWLSQGIQHPGTPRARRPQASACAKMQDLP